MDIYMVGSKGDDGKACELSIVIIGNNLGFGDCPEHHYLHIRLRA